MSYNKRVVDGEQKKMQRETETEGNGGSCAADG